VDHRYYIYACFTNTRFVEPFFEKLAYINNNLIFSLLKTVPYTRKYYFFRHCTKSTLIVWYFVSNKHYFIEQKRGKKKYVINETKTKSNEICKVRKRNPTKWNEICKVRKRNPTERNEICKVRKRNPTKRLKWIKSYNHKVMNIFHVSFRFSVYRYPIWNGNCLKMWKLGNLNTPVSHTRFVDPLFENFAYIKKNHIFSLLKTVPYTWKYHFFRHCTKSTLIVCEIFTSFPFSPNRANSPFYPTVRSSSPTYFTSTFISNSADGLVCVAY
jgi:hypothetical protein